MPSFDYDPTLFSLDDTLACGQAFRWQRLADGGWVGVVRQQVFRLWRAGSRVEYEAYPTLGGELELLRDLFLLDVDLDAIRSELISADPGLAAPITRSAGLRLMRQDPDECLLSFVCSTANNVPRIVYGVRHLSRLLGTAIATLDGQQYNSFPTLTALATADAAQVQAETGLGYRAASLVRVAHQLLRHGPGWLLELRQRPYAEAHAALTTLHGIGPKIADCVCLFSLDHSEAVPVDTHIWQVAQELWYARPAEASDPSARRASVSKGLTSAGYKKVGGEFRSRYGQLAGYAQNWLFYDHFRGYWGGVSPLLK